MSLIILTFILLKTRITSRVLYSVLGKNILLSSSLVTKKIKKALSLSHKQKQKLKTDIPETIIKIRTLF